MFEDSKALFVGDFVFKGSIGRCDLPTGSDSEMLNSLNKLKKINSEYTIYPGHYDITTLKDELKNNPYLK